MIKMDENKTITKVDDENLLITTHKEEKQLMGKQTIIAQKEVLQKEIVELDKMLAMFD